MAVRTACMGENIGIAIVDNGPAVAPAASQQLFDDPYAGVSGPHGDVVRTEGSGLFLAREIIEAHGGTLVAAGLAGRGLQVTLMLPGTS
ncbi:MAG: ATP-binding protein [Thermodesulfobacteriota bacterium]